MPNGHMGKATKNDVQIAKIEEIKESVAMGVCISQGEIGCMIKKIFL